MMSFLHRFIKIYSLSISASFLRQKKKKLKSFSFSFSLSLFSFPLGAFFEPKGCKFPPQRKKRGWSLQRGQALEPCVPGRSQVLSPQHIEPGAPCLEHGLDSMEQTPSSWSFQIPPPWAGVQRWRREAWVSSHTKRPIHGPTLHEFHSNSSMDSPRQRGQHLWGSQKSWEDKAGVTHRESPPHSLCHQLPSLICHVGYFWQITPSKSFLPCLSSQAGLVTSLTGDWQRQL